MKFLYKSILLSLLFLGMASPLVLGQRWYFESPTVFSDTLNSSAEESYPLYSAKDSTLFFVRTLYEENTGGLLSGQDIWYSKRNSKGQWDLPKNDIESLNNRDNNAVVGIADQSNTLYVMNTYAEKELSQPGLSFSADSNQSWLVPRSIHIPTLSDKQGNYYSLYVVPTEDVVIISLQNDKSLGLEDLFVSLKDAATGQWSAPVHLGPTINTSGFEISPYLSKDKKTLFFSSNGHPGYGNADIFVSTRLDSTWTKWSNPENLGDEINSVAFDAYLTISEDDEVFFVSNRNGGSADIFYSKVISEKERASDLASRIESRGEFPVIRRKNSDADPETQALIEETQRLLDEFKRGQNNTSSTGGSTTSVPTASEAVYFDLNSYGIKDEATENLDQIISLMQESADLNVRVIGHADDTGGKDYNLKLSIDRAQSVKQYLTQAGIEEDRIITFGKGSTQPLTSNASIEGRSQNRRVEIEFFTL